MKNYEWGFYAESGEFFELRENGFESGKKYYVTAENAARAEAEFLIVLDLEYCGGEMTVREIPAGHDLTDYVRL